MLMESHSHLDLGNDKEMGLEKRMGRETRYKEKGSRLYFRDNVKFRVAIHVISNFINRHC
jgi:hypothetical protein